MDPVVVAERLGGLEKELDQLRAKLAVDDNGVEGVVLACEGSGADRKATVQFDIGAKRVLVRYLTLA